jgi:transposase
MILLTEIGDISRFKNLDKLASYAGLIPDTKSSGEEEHITNITMRRNPMLRSILVESSRRLGDVVELVELCCYSAKT